MLTCYVCKDKFYLNLLQINTQLCLKEWQENSWRKKLKKIWAVAVFPNNKVDCNMVSVPAQQLSRIVSIYIICTHYCINIARIANAVQYHN